tara:strand:- start:131 stop:361 length:231 start_codon:yes stop_codon:yes gene_type:complete
MKKVCIESYFGPDNHLIEMLSLFEYGELDHNQVINLFQKILKSDLYNIVEDSMRNAIEIYARNGLLEKVKVGRSAM